MGADPEADDALHRKILGSVADPIAVEDLRTGVTVFVNRSMARALTSDESRWHEGDIARHVREQQLGEGETARVTTHFQHEDGARFPVEVLVQRIEHDGRSLAVGIARDITPQVEAQERMAAALERERLATERLLALDVLRSQIVESVSHEVRTPLTIIDGIARTLRRSAAEDPGVVDQLLQRLLAGTTRLGELLQGLLDVGHLPTRDRPLRRVETALAPLVRLEVERSSLTGPVQLELEEVTAPVDPVRVRHLLTRLLDNVARHTPPGTAVTVRLRSDDEMAVLEVADDGPGVPEELGERALDPFQRATADSDRHAPGLGIGLAAVRLTAELHGGWCRLDSPQGAGTTVRVGLPLS